MPYFRVPTPKNEPVLSYAPGSSERAKLDAALKDLGSKQLEIPLVINGKEVKTGKTKEIRCPHDTSRVLGHYHQGGAKEARRAVESAIKAQEQWASMPWEQRASVFLKTADLISGPYRSLMNAAAMLAHSKNVFQAEIDAVCELVDFLRFNCYFAQQIYEIQPQNVSRVWNRTDHRPLEGFVFAVTPFNFVSINGNLPTAPAIMGNVSVWKPASTAAYTSHFLMKIFREAGLPPGVINMLLAPGAAIGDTVLRDSRLAGIHFTGSTGTFQSMWKTVGENIANYRSYPRIVGETGGKDFIVAHESAVPAQVATAITRGAFEYQGQKCSAVSRCYLPESKWPQIKELLLKQIGELKVGDPEDYTNFVNAVIDKEAFNRIIGYIEDAIDGEETGDCEIVAGGEYDNSKGNFITPTVVVVKNPKSKFMQEEIFGPVVTVYVYPDREYAETIKLCDSTSPYALTGAVFATDKDAIKQAEETLRNAAGNFYINDKPTGAVVGQQPFGGARGSGTNDKAGGIQNMFRWTSPRSIKENMLPPADYRYPFMG